MEFKIVHLHQDVHADVYDAPESAEQFFGRIESVAKLFAEDGWKILSLSFPSEAVALLFLQEEAEKHKWSHNRRTLA